MIEYPKIDGPFVRDPKGKVILGQWRLPEFEYLKDNLWAWTEKIDGTNIRIGWDGEKVEFGGRSADSQMRTDLLIRLQELFPPEKFGIFSVHDHKLSLRYSNSGKRHWPKITLPFGSLTNGPSIFGYSIITSSFTDLGGLPVYFRFWTLLSTLVGNYT